MPIPKPKDNETQQEFVSRFMSNNEMEKEYPNNDQRLAVAFQKWRDRNKKDDSEELETKKYESINFKPTKQMAQAADKGLKMRKKQPPSNRGGTEVGLARARQLVNRQELSPDIVKRMYSFFSRHEVDKQSDSWKKGNSKGEQAWLLWGGDSGYAWSKRIVDKMNKEDSKKDGDILSIEYKSIEFEIKAIDEQGNFKGIASPYGNVDLGNDRVNKSINKRNANKKVVYLWQHDKENPIGKVKLIPTDTCMMIEGKLFLGKTDGTPNVPKAYVAYECMKNGVIKNSIGYKVMPNGAEYDSKGVRNLNDIDIKEVSAVTFPMNPKANITEVKEEGEKVDNIESKAMSMMDMMKVKDARQNMYKLMDAFNSSNRMAMQDPDMTAEQKINMIKQNAMLFATEYPKYAEMYINSMQGKDFDDEIETKAGMDMGMMQKGYTMVKEGYNMMNKAYNGMMKKKSSGDDFEFKSMLTSIDEKMKGSDF